MTDVTILIPTMNRYELIKKLLIFYELSKFKGNIIIIDSSEDKILIKTRLLIKKIKKIKIEYMEYKGDIYSAKWRVLDRIKTKYVVQSGDDDYYFEEGLTKMIKHLNENSHLTYATGDGCYMVYHTNIIDSCWYYEAPFYKDNTILKRLENFSTHNVQLNEYSIYRTDTFKKIHFHGKFRRTISKDDWYKLFEFNSSFGSAIHGPGNYIPIFYLVRTNLKNLQKKSSTSLNNKIKFDKEFKKWKVKIFSEIKKYDSSMKTLALANKKIDLLYAEKILGINKIRWHKIQTIFTSTIKNYLNVFTFRLKFKKKLHQALLDKTSSLFNAEFKIL